MRTLRLGVASLLLAAPVHAASFESWTVAPPRPVVQVADPQNELVCDPVIDIGANEAVCGDTTGLPSNIDSYLPCSPWPETGGEIIYRLTLTEPTLFAARLDAECDLDLALLGGCGAEDECFLVADTGIKTDVPVTGTYYLIVDGYNGAACSFCLTVGPPDIVAVDAETWTLVKSRYDGEGRMP